MTTWKLNIYKKRKRAGYRKETNLWRRSAPTDDNLVPGCFCRELKWDPGELLGGSWRMHKTVKSYPGTYNPTTLHPHIWRMHWTVFPQSYSGAICGLPATNCAGAQNSPKGVRVGWWYAPDGSRDPKPRCKCSSWVESENGGEQESRHKWDINGWVVLFHCIQCMSPVLDMGVVCLFQI